MKVNEASEVVDQFISAYNEGNDDKVLNLCATDILIVHHNRGIVIEGRDAFAEILKQAKQVLPDKQFTKRTAKHECGDSIIVEHSWGGTAQADFPGLAKAGEIVSLELCTRYTLKGGVIVEYHDYG